MKTRWLFGIIIGTVLLVTGSICACAAPKLVPLYTLPTGGTAYILSAGISSVTKGHLKGYELVVEPIQGATMLGKLLRDRASLKISCRGRDVS